MSGRAEAHRLDELLQSTFVAVGSNSLRLELTLAPGVSVAEELLTAVDLDRDHLLSPTEQAAFADQVVRSLEMELDGGKVSLRVEDHAMGAPDALLDATGGFQMEVATTLSALPPGMHRMHYRNRFREQQGQNIYLVNALVPLSPEIAILRQQRDPSQKEVILDFQKQSLDRPEMGSTGWSVLIAGLLLSTGFWATRNSQSLRYSSN